MMTMSPQESMLVRIQTSPLILAFIFSSVNSRTQAGIRIFLILKYSLFQYMQLIWHPICQAQNYAIAMQTIWDTYFHYRQVLLLGLQQYQQVVI
ncbi:unnamed protein product [Blepharisma stoltei]|uniref:Uncharacterized protein n=1 Tax=Blepharisma stoltei TaxID=1481888 RepID=A0AAU9J4I1_9CILI|nr:unnamed protein product [Blepharisma stoltei]